MKNVKIYDVETLFGPDEIEGGWNNPVKMGFGTAVVFDYNLNQYKLFGPQDKEKLIKELTGCIVVSFNGIKFDNAVLLGNDYTGESYNYCEWENYDLLVEVVVGKYGLATVKEAEERYGAKKVHDGSIGLDGLGKGTLGLRKTGHGSKSPDLINEGKWAEVFSYNLNDVRLTKLLFEFAQLHLQIIDGNNNVIPINRIIEIPNWIKDKR